MSTREQDAETILTALIDIYGAHVERQLDIAIEDLDALAVRGTVTREQLHDAKDRAHITAMLATLSVAMAAVLRGETAEVAVFMKGAASIVRDRAATPPHP